MSPELTGKKVPMVIELQIYTIQTFLNLNFIETLADPPDIAQIRDNNLKFVFTYIRI